MSSVAQQRGYMGEQAFGAMLLVALLVHGTLMAAYALWPRETVRNIPVRALSFKLGASDRMAAYGTPEASPVPPVEVQEAVPAPSSPPTPVPQAEWKAPKPVKPLVKKLPPEMPRQRPPENLEAMAPPVPLPEPEPAQEESPALPSLAPIIGPAIAPTPQRYVREAGLPSLDALMKPGSPDGVAGGQGSENVMTPGAAEEIRARYEQQISAWIEKHKLYPENQERVSGNVIMRVRVDRQGYVRYYAIEKSAGTLVLDRAAIEMIRRANPMPAAPANYPAGDLIEFLIPIRFEAP